MTPEELEQRLNEAFDEGHKVGYQRGQDDRGSFECGGGPRHDKAIKRDRTDDWEESVTRAYLYQGEDA